MIDYIIKSGLCLILLLAIYQILLEREKLHRFNRFFLLFSLAFGLLVPLATTGIISSPLPTIELQADGQFIGSPVLANKGVNQSTAPHSSLSLYIIFLIVYGAGASLLSFRFIINLFNIVVKVKSNTKTRFDRSTIVLLKDNVVPHSFLNYIFLNEADYLNKKIEEEMILHELTHVKQYHSLDILLMEILKIMFWFNPVFIFYKKAIQLNHEFLADDSVIDSYKDIHSYQSLLLKTAGLKEINLASNFNYSLTKKRLKMMSKHTSQRIAMLKGIALIPFLVLLLLTFSKVKAQQPAAISKDDFYKGFVIGKLLEKSFNTKKYEAMTQVEKDSLPVPVSPTADIINTWKSYEQYPVLTDAGLVESTDNPEQWRLFINGENVDQKTLDTYKPSDFVCYSATKFSKNGFTLISVNLYTNNFLKSLKGDSKLMMIYDNQIVAERLNPPFMIPKKYRY